MDTHTHMHSHARAHTHTDAHTHTRTQHAGNLSFIEDGTFNHALAFGVLTYADDAPRACTIGQ